MRSATHNRGFTLTELLVAVAIFLTLMSGITLLFVGTVRAIRQGYQQMDAFETARGALNVIRTDLVAAFGSADHGELRSFYGTPIGMTFVGITRDPGNPANTNIARITYVIYNKPTGDEFPRAFSDPRGERDDQPFEDIDRPGWPYPLLRYVEPNVGDLESFPVKWASLPVPGQETMSLQGMMETEARAACGSLDSKCAQDLILARKREFWIRMLAGGDALLPSAWGTFLRDANGQLMGPDGYRDYIVVDNVVGPLPPDTLRLNPYLLNYPRGEHCDQEQYLNYYLPDFCYQYYFSYGYAREALRDAWPQLPWWNDPKRSEWGDPDPNWSDRGLPEVVTTQLLLMFEAPTAGSPDFRRWFREQVMLQVAYSREKK